VSNEVRELKEHICWLEDQLDRSGNIEDQIALVSERLGDIEALSKGVGDICGILKEQVDVQRQLRDAFLKLVDALTPKSPLPPPSPFDIFDKLAEAEAARRAKRPKRQKFKPKVVKNDQPDGAA